MVVNYNNQETKGKMFNNFFSKFTTVDFLQNEFEKDDWYNVVANLRDILTAEISENQIKSINPTLAHEGKVYIGKGCRISDYVVIHGPVYIGDNVEIGPHAYIRPGSVVGNNCVIGHAAEIKNSVMMDGAKIANHTLLADSIMGSRARLGGHSETMNRRYDQKEIAWNFGEQKLQTSMTKLGTIIGEDTRVGGGVFIAPGVTIGKNCFVSSGINLVQSIPPYSFVKTKQELDIRENRFREQLHSRDGLYNS